MAECVEIVKVLSLLNDLVNECADKEEFFNRVFDAVDGMRASDVAPKSAIAKEIFGEIEKLKHTKFDWSDVVDWDGIAELKKKYTEGEK